MDETGTQDDTYRARPLLPRSVLQCRYRPGSIASGGGASPRPSPPPTAPRAASSAAGVAYRWHASCMTVTARSYPVLSFDALAPLVEGGAGTSDVSEEALRKAGQSRLQRTPLQARRAGDGSGPTRRDSERQVHLCRRQRLRQRPLAHRLARRLAGSGDRWLATRTRAHVQKLLPQQRPGRTIGRRWKVACSYDTASGKDRRGGTKGKGSASVHRLLLLASLADLLLQLRQGVAERRPRGGEGYGEWSCRGPEAPRRIGLAASMTARC